MRITDKMLRDAVEGMNRDAGITGEDIDGRDANGSVVWNTGRYSLSYAYGGVKVVRITNKHGGQSDISGGYDTKRNTYNFIHAWRAGFRAAQGR